MSEKQLFTRGRCNKKISNKRWVVMWFYRSMGKSYTQIADIVRHDHSSCLYGCKNADSNLKALAENLLYEYITQILHEKPDFIPLEAEPKKVTIKVPDYHKNITKYIEVDKNSIKPQKKIRKWDL